MNTEKSNAKENQKNSPSKYGKGDQKSRGFSNDQVGFDREREENNSRGGVQNDIEDETEEQSNR